MVEGEPPAPGDSGARKALEEENTRLVSQLDTLMDFERRLYELQAERDRELERLRGLNEFALEMVADAGAEEVMRRTLDLLAARFDLEQIVAVHRSDQEVLILVARGRALRVEAAPERGRWSHCFDWLTHLAHPVSVCPWQEWGPGGAFEVLAGYVDEDEHERSHLVLVPIGARTDGGARAIVLIDPRRGPSPRFDLERLDDEHLPWLALLANHVHRALQVSSLTRDVRARSLELEDSNEQLQESLRDLEQTQQRLLQTGKMEAIGRLAGGVAHDFNNLLTVIITCSRLLELEVGDAPEARGLHAELAAAGDRGATLIRQLLAFSRMQPQNPTALDLNEIVEDMTQLLARLIGEDVELVVKTCAAEAVVAADFSQLQQVLMNLVINARDAVASGGRIVVETLRPPRAVDGSDSAWVALRVTDSGRGMDDATLAQIFEPFFTTKAPGQGTGMGLATVYGIVRQSGGQIDVRSAPGRGATFEIRWPAATRPARVQGLDAGDAGEVFPTARILLVEDEAAIRRLCERILRREGHDVLVARDGVAARELFDRVDGHIDLLVTDVIMPRLGGVELAKTLSALEPGIRVLFITGYAGAKDDERSLESLGAVLPKPFASAALRKAVRELLTDGLGADSSTRRPA
jgi:signal transduction histidine kinase